MKKILCLVACLTFLSIVSCFRDDMNNINKMYKQTLLYEILIYQTSYKCNGNIQQYCSGLSCTNMVDCGSSGKRCSTAPANCGGVIGSVCCY